MKASCLLAFSQTLPLGHERLNEVQNVSQNTAQYLVLDALKCPPEAPLAIQEWLQKDMPPTRMT